MNDDSLLNSRTVPELFSCRVALSQDRVAYEHKTDGRWHPVTYTEYGEQVAHAALALSALGVAKGACVAIWGDTMPEWTILDLAAMAAGGHVAGIYQTTANDVATFIVNDTGASVMCVDTPERLAQALSLKEATPTLTHYILWSGEAPEGNDQVTTMAELYEQGRAIAANDPGRYDSLLDALSPEDYAVLIYTSGTTGNPKGVVLSHGNCVANAINVVETQQETTEEDSMVAFLPMSHVAEHTCSFLGRIYSGTSAFFCPDMTELGSVIMEKSPTVLVGVPRVYEKVYHRILDTVAQAPPMKQKLFNWAVATGGAVSKKETAGESVGPVLRMKHGLAEKLVLSKVRQRLGGRVRAVTSGAAPIDDDIIEFFLSLGILFCESYGLSEYGGCSHINARHAIRVGSVGQAVKGCEVRIADDGEVLMRSPSVFQGYLNNEKATRDVLDEDGWLYTGDIGEVDEDGFLTITDRKKNLIITAGGKNVAPSNIELLVRRETIVSPVVVVGERKPFLIALVTLSPEVVEAESVSDDDARNRVSESIDNANLHLARYEQIKQFHILDHDFTIDSGEMTPTMKIKRNVVLNNNAEVIDKIYDAPQVQ